MHALARLLNPSLVVGGLAATLAVTPALAADSARERRWAEEIAPHIVVGEPRMLRTEHAREFLALFTEAERPKAALIVVHGRGIHPDFELIGVLRTRLVEHGYTTLSIQMPVLQPSAAGDDYLPTFPQARARLSAAVRFLQAEGYRHIGLVSHSMGTRMSADYLRHRADAPLFAWAAISLTHDRLQGLEALKFPVLDIYGERDLPQVLANNAARAEVLRKVAGARSAAIAGADHFFEGHEDPLIEAIGRFLAGALPR